MRTHAARAIQGGRHVLVVRIQTRFWSAGAFSGPMDDTAEMIEAIEDTGWALDQMSYVIKSDNKPEGMYLFRRPRHAPGRAPQPAGQHRAAGPDGAMMAGLEGRDSFRRP
jgi:hypothetical protein